MEVEGRLSSSYIQSLNIYLKSISHILHIHSILVHCSSVYSYIHGNYCIFWINLTPVSPYLRTTYLIFASLKTEYSVRRSGILARLSDLGIMVPSLAAGYKTSQTALWGATEELLQAITDGLPLLVWCLRPLPHSHCSLVAPNTVARINTGNVHIYYVETLCFCGYKSVLSVWKKHFGFVVVVQTHSTTLVLLRAEPDSTLLALWG